MFSRIFNYKFIFFITFFLFFSSLNYQQSVLASEKKDVILVLDTSLSMVGFGGKNILPDVKKSINRYISNLEHGDRVTFITFDEDVRGYPSVLVDDENDKDILKKYISMTEAKGKWTHTLKMIQAIFAKAEEIKNDGENRQVVIVIMTDGLDDPPPNGKEQTFKLSEIADKYQGKDWWIYFISLSDLKKNEKIKKTREKFEKQLIKVSSNTKIIDASKDLQKVISKDLPKDVSRLQKMNESIFLEVSLIVVVVFLILGIVYYFMLNRNVYVYGKLEYWNTSLLSPSVETFDMSKYRQKKIKVGKCVGCHLNLRNIDIKEPFIISAFRNGKEVEIMLNISEKLSVEFVNKDENMILQDGDIFKISNYSFKVYK